MFVSNLWAQMLCFANVRRRDRVLEQLAHEFQQRHADSNMLEILILLVILLGGGIALWYLGQLITGERDRRPQPRRLFWQLARAHGLKTWEILQLWYLVTKMGVEDPNLIFVAPDVFAGLKSPHNGRKRAWLEALGEKLFADLAHEQV